MHRICIIGSNGMLGRELVALVDSGIRPAVLASRFVGWNPSGVGWDAEVIPCRTTALDIDELDITCTESVLNRLEQLRPTLVINAAAYTDVDGCESRELEAACVNVSGPANLAEACGRCGARLVHVSTDYVFNGVNDTPYTPEHPICPQSAYGRTKVAGEAVVRRRLPERHVILRTSWLFGVHGKNFVKTILKLAHDKPELRVVTDQVGCPTYAADLAAALLVAGLGGQVGTFHFCNQGACSWNEFATEIVKLSGCKCPVLPMSSVELNRPAPRPAYSVLCTQSFTRAVGLQPRPWREALAECVRMLSDSAQAV